MRKGKVNNGNINLSGKLSYKLNLPLFIFQ